MFDVSGCSVCPLHIPVAIQIPGQEPMSSSSYQSDEYLCIDSEMSKILKPVGLMMTANCYLMQSNYLTMT